MYLWLMKESFPGKGSETFKLVLTKDMLTPEGVLQQLQKEINMGNKWELDMTVIEVELVLKESQKTCSGYTYTFNKGTLTIPCNKTTFQISYQPRYLTCIQKMLDMSQIQSLHINIK